LTAAFAGAMIRVVSLGQFALCRGAVLVLLVVAAQESAGAQARAAPSDGSNLQGWKVEHIKAHIRDGVLRVGKGNGWVRTERVYADFVLSLDVRIPPDRAAALFVRAWPTFDRSSRPSNGYRLILPGARAAAQSNGWQHIEVECSGGTVKVRADGVLVHSAEALRNPQGHVALSAPETTVEYKAVQIREVPRRPQPTPDAVEAGGAVQAPIARLTPNPRYTGEAMRARITGKVVMQGVVQTDGTIRDVRLVQSLDPHFGVDESALETASKWTFTPGMRDGRPVPVRIVIELHFSLTY
jgi:TonB family protein